MMEEWIPLSLLMDGGRKDEWRKAVALASRFGLTLSPAEKAMLRAARQEALRDAGRVEFGESALSHLVRAFCDSPWVERETWAETLAALREQYPVAIVSNKPDGATKALCADFFPGICAMGQSDGFPRKPAPDMVFRAMQEIGADTCIYVGDSEVDILTAKNADVPCISVLWGFRDRKELAAAGGLHFCEEPSRLTETVNALIAKTQR